RRPQYETQFGTVPRNAESWTPGCFVHAQAVVVKPDAGVNTDIAEPHLVLYVECLLTVKARSAKGEAGGCRRIKSETGRRRNLIRERLMHRAVKGICSGFQIVMPKLSGETPAGIAVPESTLLKSLNRNRLRIRFKTGCQIPHTGLYSPQQRRSKDVLIGNLACCFFFLTVLPLAGGLLQLFIRHLESNLAVADRGSQAIALR